MRVAEKKPKQEKIHVKIGDFSVETFIKISKKKIRVKENLTYFWYKSRSINSTKGGYSGQLLDGNYDRFDMDKKLIEQGKFVTGLKHGIWKIWHPNGELKSKIYYRKGLKHGLEVVFNSEGVVIGEYKYSRGNLNH